MRTFLPFTLLLVSSFICAQSGNTLAEAIIIDGTDISLNILDFENATASGEGSPCLSISEDVFYKHTISAGENTLTIQMNSSVLTLLATIEYQILLAPGGVTGNLQEIECNSYDVLLGIGGNFTKVIPNVTPFDDYYMRIKKTREVDLISNTTISMTSDVSLSTGDFSNEVFNIVVKHSTLNFIGEHDFLLYDIYSLDGKRVVKNKISPSTSAIDISGLSKGIYILNLKNKSTNQIFKFVKY